MTARARGNDNVRRPTTTTSMSVDVNIVNDDGENYNYERPIPSFDNTDEHERRRQHRVPHVMQPTVRRTATTASRSTQMVSEGTTRPLFVDSHVSSNESVHIDIVIVWSTSRHIESQSSSQVSIIVRLVLVIVLSPVKRRSPLPENTGCRSEPRMGLSHIPSGDSVKQQNDNDDRITKRTT